jgi:enoyl-CoA hydratase/carnithine racemase
MPETDDDPTVRFERFGHVAIITLNRPARGNALSSSMDARLRACWQEVRDNGDIRVTVITGAGERHFCTGADLTEVADSGPIGGGYGPMRAEVRWSPRQNEIWKPTICAVNGLVAGGGLHFVVDSDIVVAAENAQFLDTHVDVGMVGAIENIGLARRLPIGTALRMTLQGRAFRLSARRAYELGLVDELVEPGQALDAALAIAHDIAKNSPNAVSLSMRAVWSALEMPYSTAMEYGYALLRMHWRHPDFDEGPRAFAAKRAPVWAEDVDPDAAGPAAPAP